MIANAAYSDHADVVVVKVLGVLCDFGDTCRWIAVLIPQNAALCEWMDWDYFEAPGQLCCGNL